ncbi:MAG: hypothetical protein HYZ49_13635 [Chloroflexi bacterium]|nr:hypothetical protein [Chloroflexota bacterium]
MIQRQTQTAVYWDDNFIVEDADLEHLNNLLLEDETPLTADELVLALIRRRVEREEHAIQRQLYRGGAVYLPKETFAVGQEITFAHLQFASGRVAEVRPGLNPEIGEFDVIAIDFGDGKAPRHFAARMAEHKLNEFDGTRAEGDAPLRAPEELAAEYGPLVWAKLEARFKAKGDVVRIATRWFPRGLLATINEGHLNLAEAVLDMAGGGPLPTSDLLPHLDLPATINEKLKTFSLDYALQEDSRFDEVGPAGQVLWFLHRLEPAEVTATPRWLRCERPSETAALPDVLSQLEVELDDEFGPMRATTGETSPAEVTLTLTFPHRRAGTLPLSPALSPLFPTAYESPRIRFTLIDGFTGEKHPGWVVRQGRYVFGLAEWYQKYEMLVGGHIKVSRGDNAGEVVIKITRRKPTREWVRTATVSEGRVSFAMQKRPIAVDYDEQMIVSLDNLAAIDDIWTKAAERRTPLAKVVADTFRELAKLTPQSAVHARSLYSAVNVIRRSPAAPIFAELVSQPYFVHVGDAYWRFDDSAYTE